MNRRAFLLGTSALAVTPSVEVPAAAKPSIWLCAKPFYTTTGGTIDSFEQLAQSFDGLLTEPINRQLCEWISEPIAIKPSDEVVIWTFGG